MRNSADKGFSAVEMLVVIAIMAILAAIAAPSFRAMLLNIQIRTAAESVNNGIQLAKAEAVRRNVAVTFTMTAVNGTGWTVGCQTPIADGNGDGIEDCPAIIQAKSPGNSTTATIITITPAGANTLTFNGLGRVAPNIDASNSIATVNIDVATSDLPASESKDLRIMINGGAVRMCDPNIVTTGDARGC